MSQVAIVQKKPHMYELLNLAAKQKLSIKETRVEILRRPASIWFYENNSNRSKSSDDQHIWYSFGWFGMLWQNFELSIYHKYFIYYSRFCEKIRTSQIFSFIRFLMWPLLLIILCYECPQDDYGINNDTDLAFEVIDYLVNLLFLLDCFLRLSGLYISIKIEKAYHRILSRQDIIRKSGIFAFIIIILNLSYGISYMGLWLRLFTIIIFTDIVLDFSPYLDILMSCLTHGLKSITFTILIFFGLILCYGSIGFYLFSENDPFHFGNYILSCLQFFCLSTLENWSTILYISMYGCNGYQSEYQYTSPNLNNLNITDYAVQTKFGVFFLPQCNNPQSQPLASLFVLISYVIANGFVISELTIAAVAIGFDNRLQELKVASVYGEEEENEGITNHVPISTQIHRKKSDNKILDAKASKLLGSVNIKKTIATMMKRIWEGKVELTQNARIDHSFSLKNLALESKFIQKDYRYSIILAIIILLDVSTQLVENINERQDNSTIGIHIFCQVMFTIDCLLTFITYHPSLTKKNFYEYLNNKQSILVLIVTLLFYLPIIAPYYQPFNIIHSLRVFRVLLFLQIWSNYNSDLNVTLGAIVSSIITVIYCIILILIIFIYYAIAGVLLFKDINPFYFKQVPDAMLTLLQVMSLDNWSDVMRKCIFGCYLYGYSTGLISFDNTCVSSDIGLGWWSPIYFVSFIIISAMVLLSLIVGVIISSMELLKEAIVEENEMWKKTHDTLKRLHVNPNMLDLFLELFDVLDNTKSARLVFEDLKPLMEIVNMPQSEQFAFFVMVDVDRSGLIDFAEFCEMIILMGEAQKSTNNNLKKNISPAVMSIKAILETIGLSPKGQALKGNYNFNEKDKPLVNNQPSAVNGDKLNVNLQSISSAMKTSKRGTFEGNIHATEAMMGISYTIEERGNDHSTDAISSALEFDGFGSSKLVDKPTATKHIISNTTIVPTMGDLKEDESLRMISGSSKMT